MNDLISRTSLLRNIGGYGVSIDPYNIIRLITQKILAEPEVDTEPVRHARWLPTSDDNKKRCSGCDIIHLIAQYPHGHANWCPNCGAKIKAEFTCNEIFRFNKQCEPHDEPPGSPCEYWIDWEEASNWIGDSECDLFCATQLNIWELDRYIGTKSVAYGWGISGVIDYCSTKGYRVRNISEYGLKRPPQSWQYLNT